MKYIKITIIFLLILFSLYVYYLHNDYYEYAKKIPVLTFHRLVLDEVKRSKYVDNQWVGSIKVFAEMMEYLYNNGYNTISMDTFIKWYNKEIELPKKSVLITFDDGFSEDYYLAYPILKKYDFHATSFIVGKRINEVTNEFDPTGETKSYIGQDVISKLREEYPNFEFQSHSYNMHRYTKDKKHKIEVMDYDEIDEDIKKTKEYGFNAWAYPFGDYNDMIMELLPKNGYDIAFGFGHKTYARRTDNRFNIHRIKLNGNSDLHYLKTWLKYL